MPLVHSIPAICGSDAHTLLLGSFPSPASRQAAFFYGHPQNRFWKVLAAICRAPVPGTAEEKTRLLLDHGYALWDVIASCEIHGASDSSIRAVTPNDLRPLLRESAITRVFCNGATAFRLYRRYCQTQTGIDGVCLPSTSPANAAWSMERLIAAWRVIAPVSELP